MAEYVLTSSILSGRSCSLIFTWMEIDEVPSRGSDKGTS